MESDFLNLAHHGLYTDLYELTMLYGYFNHNKIEDVVTFEVHFRKLPFNGGYAVIAGIPDVLNYLNNLSFTDSDLVYLESLNKFSKEFLQYLKSFRFTGVIEFIPEGRVVFPYEPIIQITAKFGEAQLIESAILNMINYQTLIATKASRIVTSAYPNKVLEFGLRRAQNDASIVGARASVIGGCIGSSNVMAGKLYGIPVSGTHAHSWIMSFANNHDDVKETELRAFRAYAEIYPADTILLVDTYNTLLSGVPNAIVVGKELKEKGFTLRGIRIDSGDLVWLTTESAKMLDREGLTETLIVLSNDLDENIIESIQLQFKKQLENADEKDKEFYNRLYHRIVYGVGTSLITGSGDKQSALTGVYKLTEINNKAVMKFSENIEKRTNPHRKELWRIEKDNTYLVDVISLPTDDNPKSQDTIYHVSDPSKKLKLPPKCTISHLYFLIDFSKQDLIQNQLKEHISIDSWKKAQIRLQDDLKKLDYSYIRLLNPHTYKISLSEKLMDIKKDLQNFYSNFDELI